MTLPTIHLTPNLALTRVVQGFYRLPEWQWSTLELNRFIDGVLAKGINCFDLAEIYGLGEAERQLGRVLKAQPKLREQIILVSKTGISKTSDGFAYYDTRPERIIQSCKESLQRLQTSYLDLYLIHREDSLLDAEATARALQQLIDEGLVRAVGVSNFDPYKFDLLNKALGGILATNQIEWSLLCHEHLKNGLLDHLQMQKCHPMYWSCLGGGQLFSAQTPEAKATREVLHALHQKYAVPADTLAYAWALKHPAQGAVICGSSQLDRVQHAIDACQIDLTLEDWYRLFAAPGISTIR